MHRTPRPVFELEDLRGREIEGQFYSEELVPVRVTKKTTYTIDKISGQEGQTRHSRVPRSMDRIQRGFDSWVPATDIQPV